MIGADIERGLLSDGTPYRIWRLSAGRNNARKMFAFIELDGRERRRSVKWIRGQKRMISFQLGDARDERC